MNLIVLILILALSRVEGQSRPRSRDEMSIMEIINATQQLSEVSSKKIQKFIISCLKKLQCLLSNCFIFSLAKYYGMPDYTKHF